MFYLTVCNPAEFVSSVVDIAVRFYRHKGYIAGYDSKSHGQ
ncbi:MAG: hypothetical protein ACTIIF_05495 [Psychrobacter celer]